jgi:hypothetical protein
MSGSRGIGATDATLTLTPHANEIVKRIDVIRDWDATTAGSSAPA